MSPHRRLARWSAAAFALVGLTVPAAAAASLSMIPGAGPAARPDSTDAVPGTRLDGCPVLPANDYWNTDISSLPVSRHSDDWLGHMSPDSFLHPDFGRSYGEQPVPYGIPITFVDDSHPMVHVAFRYRDESDRVPYPLGDDTRIEGGRRSTGDRHAIVLNASTCELYETWDTRQTDGSWHAGSGATWNLHSNRLRRDGWTSADAAGLPILPGLLRYREVEVTGEVGHAIRFTTDVTQRRHIWPARHDAGSTDDSSYPPMGARFRLSADFPLAGYRHDTVVVLRAMQKYGLVLADNGSPWYFQGTADNRWPAGLISELKTIPASAFQAVDTRQLEIRHNSGRARQPTG